ncbi:MAG: hypothetical protein KatS3mg089_0800 [Patescibacteria group bacterium]|nr:MAG: hypothetical protein KatS3mg089_0800 [Patescibacteria group bacterium]
MKLAIKKSVAIVFFLGIIALNLTLFVIYRIFSDFSSPENSIDQNNQNQKTSEQKANGQAIEVGPAAPKIELLRVLPPDIPESERKKHEDFLRKNARETAIVFINRDCDSSPTVAKIVGVATMKFINEDKVEHTVTIAGKSTFTVKPGIPYLIKVNTLEKNKLIAYTCDKKDNLSGYIYIP